MPQVALQQFHRCGISALLRPKYACRAALAQGRILHIGSDHDVDIAPALIEPALINCRELRQTAAAKRNIIPVRVKKLQSQRA